MGERKQSVRKLKEIISQTAFNDLDDAIEALLDIYQMEKSLQELSKPVTDDPCYYEKELELTELFNLILTLKQIKTRRTP